jgi:hypothetical protein
MTRTLLTAIFLTLLSHTAFSEVGRQYKCTVKSFLVGTKHSFKQHDAATFLLSQDYTEIRISGGFLDGNSYQYTSLGREKFVGQGIGYTFKFDKGYFVWTRVATHMDEIYIITANCF